MVKKIKRGDLFKLKYIDHILFREGCVKKKRVYQSLTNSDEYTGVDFIDEYGEISYLNHSELKFAKKYKGGFKNEK